MILEDEELLSGVLHGMNAEMLDQISDGKRVAFLVGNRNGQWMAPPIRK